jgi:hypothetical protein
MQPCRLSMSPRLCRRRMPPCHIREGVTMRHRWVSVAFAFGVVVSAANAQDDFSRRMEEDSLRRSQQKALDNYNRQMEEQRQITQMQQMHIQGPQKSPINLNSAQDLLDAEQQAPDIVHGYVLATFDELLRRGIVCPPAGATYTTYEMIPIVNSYLTAMPILLKERPDIAIGAALLSKWPCQQKSFATGRDFLPFIPGTDSATRLFAYVAGVMDTEIALHHVCAPNVDRTLPTLQVIYYINTNPKTMDSPIANVVASALIEKWPCKK